MDRLRFVPETARFFKKKPVAAIGLASALIFGAVTHEGALPLEAVKIGSSDPAIAEQLREHGGATLRGGPSTLDAPIGKAPIGTTFEVEDVVSGNLGGGNWVVIKLGDNPSKNVEINYELLSRDSNGAAIIPDHLFVNRSLVKRIDPSKIHSIKNR